MYKFQTFNDAYLESRTYNKGEKVAGFPPYVTFELLNNCNFQCLMCHTTYLEAEKQHLSLDLFKKAIGEISHYGSLVRFIGYCEPLLYSHIEEAISYVKSKNLMLHITTNGSLLTERMIKIILDSQMECLIISFQGLSQEEFCFMRKVNLKSYNKVISNIKSLYNQRTGSKPFIKLTTTVTERDNLSRKDDFIKEHLQYVDEVQITGFTHFVHLDQCFHNDNIWERLKISKPDKIDNLFCHVPNYEMLVKRDGGLYCCCGAFSEDMCMGNFNNDSLHHIWHSSKAEHIRNVISRGDMENFITCSVCPIRYVYGEIGNTVMNARKDTTGKYQQ